MTTQDGQPLPPWTAPVDLTGLVSHAAHIPGELAVAWARGLSDPEVRNGITALEIRMQSLLTAYRGIHTGDQQVQLSELPLSDVTLNRLSRGGVDEIVRSADAEVAVLYGAMDALHWAREPSTVVLRLPEGEEETLWDAGVFASCRDQLSLLVRVREHVDRVARQKRTFPSWMRLMGCAQRAANAGLPEAVLLYLRLVLEDADQAFADAEAIESDQPPGQPVPAADTKDPLGSMPTLGEEFAEVRDAFARLVQLVEGWAVGEPGDLPTIVLLADALLRRMNRAVSTRLFAFDQSAAHQPTSPQP